MGRSSVTRGKSGEHEIAAPLRDELGLEIQRNLEQPQSAHGDDFDLVGVGDFALEVKRIARFLPKLLTP